MRLSALVMILTTAFFTVSASAPVISGRVVDKNSQPIADATVSLKVKGVSVKSDAAGTFALSTVAITSPIGSGNTQRTFFIKGRNLFFTNEFSCQLKVELFDMNGKRVSDVFNHFFAQGSFSLSLSSLITSRSADGLYIVRISKGNEIHTLPFSLLCSFAWAGLSGGDAGELLAKQLATADSLIVTKEKYTPFSRAIDSDSTQDVGDIQLSLASDPDVEIEQKVNELLAKMTKEEKIAQTAEAVVTAVTAEEVKSKGYGSVFNGGGAPFGGNTKDTWASNLDALHEAAKQSKNGIPILYGIDAVHGVATIAGATVFPHNIAMGCTGDTALVAKMANITAKECRAVGINLNFGPAISVVRNEKWGRTYEGYGETPEINSLMAGAYVRGLQGYGDMSRPDAVAACAKHFIGDGGTTNGVNGGVTSLSEATMRAVHLPPYQAAVSQRVSSIMPSYNAWNRGGTEYRCTNDKFSLTDMLKTGLTWDGFCLSDWDAIPQAVTPGQDVYTADNVGKAVAAGIDMAMIAPFYNSSTPGKKITDYMSSLSQSIPSPVSEARLDDAVRRILRIKYRLNLFENAKSNASLREQFGSAEHRAVARECVRKSIVLLKNEGNALPLKKTEKVVVAGPWAKSLGAQCGGWTISWQGEVNNPTISGGTTILQGLQNIGSSNVVYDETGNNLSSGDKIVLVIGEVPYAEGQGDHGHTNPTQPYPDCPQCDLYKNKAMSIILADCPNADLLDKCFNSGKPVVVVLISGRPMIITQEIAKAKAFVAAWLPGSEGAGIADVLFAENGAGFTGKLTHTWPRTIEQIPINTGTSYSDEQKGGGGDPLFPYGHGLSY
ncbi:MAG: glycoside hydrolase family 3 C-terminal domain-containing protein [Chitinispirillaceae bacterium]|nr:glycoside hydrolase family 3 C-terminal domain-containing protein [Chitinispirillaceae bacterium]